MDALHEQVKDAVSTLFHRYPALCGFSVQPDLSFSHVSCHPALLGEEARELNDEIRDTLQELVEAQPEAADLLRGRTLARSFH
jgi:hypothetical protein